MALTSLHEILTAARQLPRRAQAELVETLLRESSPLPVEPTALPPLDTLRGLSEAELRAVAGAVLAPGYQRRLKNLLRKNKHGGLGDKERQELDALLEESDQVALLKAKATYTLLVFGLAGAATA